MCLCTAGAVVARSGQPASPGCEASTASTQILPLPAAAECSRSRLRQRPVGLCVSADVTPRRRPGPLDTVRAPGDRGRVAVLPALGSSGPASALRWNVEFDGTVPATSRPSLARFLGPRRRSSAAAGRRSVGVHRSDCAVFANGGHRRSHFGAFVPHQHRTSRGPGRLR